jgi:hypothetical protein
MRATIITTFVAIAMIAAVFLAWAPEAKAGGIVSPQECCDPQLDQADCFCATKFGGWVREVPCTYDAVCSVECGGIGTWECNIQPVKCNWWEEGKVLQRFIPFEDRDGPPPECGCLIPCD